MTEIVELLERRDQQGLERLQEAYGPWCRAILAGILRNPEDIQEALNDLWLQVWNAIPPAKPRNLQAWLGKIARNTALNYIKHEQAQKRDGLTVLFDELSECLPDPGWERENQSRELRESIGRFLRSCKPLERQMFLRRYWYGDSLEQLAERFRCSYSKAASLLFRLRKRLRKHLEQEGVGV